MKELAAGEWMTVEKFSAMFRTAANNYQYLAAPSKEFRNTHGYCFTFDLYKSGDPGSQDNISFAEYTSAKLATLQDALGDLDQHTTAKPGLSADYYIRAEFTDWDVKDGYEMILDEETGLYRFEVSGSKKLKLSTIHTSVQQRSTMVAPVSMEVMNSGPKPNTTIHATTAPSTLDTR